MAFEPLLYLVGLEPWKSPALRGFFFWSVSCVKAETADATAAGSHPKRLPMRLRRDERLLPESKQASTTTARTAFGQDRASEVATKTALLTSLP